MTPAETHPLKGVLFMLLAVMLFAVLDATGKYLSQRYPIPFLAWSRYIVHLLMMLGFLAPSWKMRLLRTQNIYLQVLRALALTTTSLCFLGALSRLPLAEATAIVFIAPMLVTALAGPLLGESVTRVKWIGVIGGFVGVLFIVQPAFALSPFGLMLALAAMACLCTYHLLTRKLAGNDHPLTTLFYTALVGSITLSLILPFSDLFNQFPAQASWRWLDAMAILSLGIYGAAGHLLLIHAFRHSTASTLMPFTFLQLFWAVVLGGLIFGQWPNRVTATGMIIIALSGLHVAIRESRNPSSPTNC